MPIEVLMPALSPTMEEGTLKHGGTEAPVLPHTMSIGRVTIARRYIGLRSQG